LSVRWGEEATHTTTPRPRASSRPSRSKPSNPMAYETFADVAQDLPRFIDEVYNRRRLHSALAISARNSLRTAASGPRSNQRPDRCPPQGAHSRPFAKFHRVFAHPPPL
jgi:hypothetical protein